MKALMRLGEPRHPFHPGERVGDHGAMATLDRRGRVTIPKSVRVAAGIGAGQQLHYTRWDDGTLIIRGVEAAPASVSPKPVRTCRSRASK